MDQTELGFLLNIFPFGNMFNVHDKQNEGISLKLSDMFLKENELKWDDTKFWYEKLPESKFNSNIVIVQKLNLLLISSELNLPKIYVQSGLNNIFKSIGSILNSNTNNIINLGGLGHIHSKLKIIHHVSTKIKKETIFNRKASIKSLLIKNQDDNLITVRNPKYVTSKNFYSNNRENYHLNSSNNISLTSNLEINQKEIKSGDGFILDKMKHNIKFLHVSKHEGDNKFSFDNESFSNTNYPNFKNRINLNNTTSNFNNNSRFNATIGRLLDVPLKDSEWNFKEIMNSTFRKKDRPKQSQNPVLFNAYSNTKAAPFTSEKTQIPISHRIASFYSLTLQNFVIDKSSKSIKKLQDEYFLKFKKVNLPIPATEEEEYLSLLNIFKDTKKVELRKQTYERYQNYIIKHIPDDVIAEIKETWLINIIKMSMRPYDLNHSDKYNDMLNDFIKDIIFIYRVSMKQAIIDYVLKHPEQREKLGIPVSFRKIKEYAENQVNRPSDDNFDWKKNWNISKIRLSNNLMIINSNVTKINKYFVKNLSTTSYLELPVNWSSYPLGLFIDNQKAKIEDQKRFINEDWRKFIEGVIKENKLYKDQMIIYFKSISAIMSTQLRKVILKSLEDYYKFILGFKKTFYYDAKKVFEDQFKPEFPFQKSFLEVSIKSSYDKQSFIFSDDLSDIHNKLLSLIHDLTKCSQDVERPDNMFIKNLEKKNNLWEIPLNDLNLSMIMVSIDQVIKENLDSVNKVIDIYEPFVFILNEQAVLEKFKLSQPKREDIKKKISFYEENLKNLRENMPNSLYMNLIKIDCTEINSLLRNSLVEYTYEILRFIQNKNITGKSKEINDEIEKLTDELKHVPRDEEELYNLETKLESYKNEIVPMLLHNYSDFLEWVFFYLDYDKYQIFQDLTKPNDSIGNIETIVRTSHHTVKLISPAMETYESILKEKRSSMEQSLVKSQSFYNQYVIGLKKEVDHYRDSASTLLHDESLILKLKELDKKINDTFNMLNSLIKKEELLGAYPTEGDKLEICKKDLEPLIHYITFYNESKEIFLNDLNEIKNMDFVKMMNFIERSNELTHLKTSIQRKKNEFETIKISAEAGKAVFSLIEILKYDKSFGENKSLIEENKIYCVEFTKLLFLNEKGQEFLKTLKFNEFLRYPNNLEKFKENKSEIEKIIEEWENVKTIYDLIARVVMNCDITFDLENFKDKKYVVISHKNFENIKITLLENVKILEENIEKYDQFKYSNKTFFKMVTLKNNLNDLNELIQNFEANQIKLENNMVKSVEMQKKQDQFMKLKQAEQYYKFLIDFIIENPKIMDILRAKDSLTESIHSLAKILLELPYSNVEHQIDKN